MQTPDTPTPTTQMEVLLFAEWLLFEDDKVVGEIVDGKFEETLADPDTLVAEFEEWKASR